VQAGNTDLGRLLLDVGADLIKPGIGGNQAVHVAAAHGHMGFLQMCVARGADLDVANCGMKARPRFVLLSDF
jgi:ankyrin repeat protein